MTLMLYGFQKKNSNVEIGIFPVYKYLACGAHVNAFIGSFTRDAFTSTFTRMVLNKYGDLNIKMAYCKSTSLGHVIHIEHNKLFSS